VRVKKGLCKIKNLLRKENRSGKKTFVDENPPANFNKTLFGTPPYIYKNEALFGTQS